MESSGFSSPRPDCFPAGLRVLVVDDDPTWLKILEKMLKKCNYEVTTCNLAREALDLLRGRKDGYDIVISDVNMPDMDGFKLLEHVGLEMDLPVIMMSVDGETSRVMKGVQHGACDYLLKPIRMKELRNIWQHVFRKKIHEVRDIEGHESLEELQMMRSAAELSDDGYFFGGDQVLGKKRKDVDSKNDDRVCGESSSSKKARVVWTVDLHQKFVKAVNLIGFEKVGPKKILDLMGVPWLTRENVASHLQKYRLYLSRLQKENELKATVGVTKHSELPLKDFASNACSKIPVPHDDKANLSMTESKAALPRETNDHSKSSASSISFDHSFGPLNSDAVSKPKIQVQYSWGGAAPPVGFKHEQIPHGRVRPLQFKKDQKPAFSAEQQFDHLPFPIHHIQIPSVETGLNSGTESKTTTSQHGETVTKVESTAALFSVHHESHHTIDPIPKGQSLEVQNLFTDPDSWNRDALLETGSSLRLWEEGFTEYSPQTEVYPLNPYLGAVDPFGFSNPDVPLHLYDSLKFNPEFSVDPMEYPVIDQGLYIA